MEWSVFFTIYGIGVAVGIIIWHISFMIIKKNKFK